MLPFSTGRCWRRRGTEGRSRRWRRRSKGDCSTCARPTVRNSRFTRAGTFRRRREQLVPRRKSWQGKWENDDGDRRWVAPTAFELRNEIDHFHLPSDSVANRETWAEWHYFNVLSPDRKRWAFISFIVGGDVTGTKWGGQIGITLREQDGATRRFATTSRSVAGSILDDGRESRVRRFARHRPSGW